MMNLKSILTATAVPGLAPSQLAPPIWHLRAPPFWRGLRRRLAAGRRSLSRFEKRLRKSASKGKPIVLGSPDRPFEPPRAAMPWEVLRPFEGLVLRITTGSPEILADLPSLVELDRRHSVAVDVVASDLDPRSRELREGLRTVRELAGEGITTRLVVPRRRQAGLARGPLGTLFEAARDAGAFDVRLAGRRRDRAAAALFRELRLAHGFPCPRPGRG